MSKEWIEVPLSITDKIGQWAIWAVTRFVIVSPLLIASLIEWISGAIHHLAKQFKYSYIKIMTVYDALPYGGLEGYKVIEAEVKSMEQSIEPITDIHSEIEGKQVMIVGESGSGKSTIAQYLAQTIGGRVTVYDCETTPQEWIGLEVIGKAEDFEGINTGMEFDLQDLSSQIQLRAEKGDAALVGTERVLIVEEYPAVAQEVEVAKNWMIRHARRGRKAKRFLIVLAQDDNVRSLGIEGEGGIRKAFKIFRLGKTALTHARSLKNEALISWLKSDRSHALIDDEPLTLPSYREMKAATLRPQANYDPATPAPNQLTPESPIEPAFEPISQEFPPTLDSILEAIAAGKSDDWITKHVLKTPGGQTYIRNKARVAALRNTTEEN